MKYLISFTLLLLCMAPVKGQDNNSDGPSGLKITECEFEPDAPGVVLFDKGEVSFIQDEHGFIMCFKRHKRIKIFKEAAFNQAEIEIHLYQTQNDLERLEDVKATTYFYNGQTLETSVLDKSQIYEEPVNKFWYLKKFTLPNIKEGCVIDFSYTIRSPFFTYLPDWEFQSDIPTYYSEYKTKMIPFYTYTYVAQRIGNFDVFSKEKDTFERSFMNLKFYDQEYTFGLKNIHSFNDESFITSREDYIKKIDFQLCQVNYPSGYSMKYMSTWPELSKELLHEDYFGNYIKKAEKAGKKDFLHLQNLSDAEKIESVISYMKANFKHDGVITKWATKSMKDFTTQKTGNSANINLMAIGILNGLGVNIKPVIISTRDHGKVIDSFPLATLFNDVLILYINDNKTRIYDATDPFYSNDEIPSYCYNGKGYIVDENEQWVYIKDMFPSNKSITLSYTVDTDNYKIQGDIAVKSTGQTGVEENKAYNSNPSEFKSSIEKNGITITDNIAIPENDKSEGRDFKYKFAFESKIAAIDDKLIIHPFIYFPIQDNPLKQKERDYDIDFIYPRNNVLTAMIKIPEGFKVDNIPTTLDKETDNLSIHYKTICRDNQILISATYSIKNAQYPSSAYNELKQFYNILTQKLNESIVLTKTVM